MQYIRPKEPNEVLDYKIDWSDELGNDTIQSSSFTVSNGITISSTDNDNNTTTVVLSGGTAGEEYIIENQITQNDGTISKRSFILPVTKSK